MNYEVIRFKNGDFAVTNEHGMYRVHSPKHGKFMWVCPKCKTIAGKSSDHGCHSTKETRLTSPPRGKSIPDTVEAWKHHAHLLADLIEEQRDELARTSQALNKMTQSRDKHKLAHYKMIFGEKA